VTNVTGLQEGVYTFQLEVTDNDGASTTDTVTVTVKPTPNVPPTASAETSSDKIKLPANTVTLNGSSSDDSDGSIAAYAWTVLQEPAPNAATLADPDKVSTSVTMAQAGVYNFQLKVTDDDGAESTDAVTVYVYPADLVKTGSISFPNLDSGDDIDELDFSPSITLDGGADADFQETDITSTLAVSVNGNAANPVVGYTIDVSDYNNGDELEITETFFYNGQIINTLTVTAKVVLSAMWGDKKFNEVTPASDLPFTLTKPAPLPPEWPPFTMSAYVPSGLFQNVAYDILSGEPAAYGQANYTKNTLDLALTPHLDLEVEFQPIFTPLGVITPGLTERLDIGLQWRTVSVAADAGVPDYAVAEIEDLQDTGTKFQVTVANKLGLSGVLDLLNGSSHLSAEAIIRNTSHYGSSYSGSLGFEQDLEHKIIKGFALKATGGYATKPGGGFWRADALLKLWPGFGGEQTRLDAGLEWFGRREAVGSGLHLEFHLPPRMSYSLGFGWLDITRVRSIYGKLIAQIYLNN
jgi:hypothetical protein